MSITTKGGDKGQTSLYSGERVMKSDLRVDSYGTLDELDAFIGEAKHYVEDEEVYHLLIATQNKLYRVMGQLATPSSEYPMPVCESEVDEITQTIRDYEAKVDLKGFVIPGSCPASAKLDICRTIARRAERRVIALSEQAEVPETLMKYINRLSDFFFILARYIEVKQGVLTYKTKTDQGCES